MVNDDLKTRALEAIAAHDDDMDEQIEKSRAARARASIMLKRALRARGWENLRSIVAGGRLIRWDGDVMIVEKESPLILDQPATEKKRDAVGDLLELDALEEARRVDADRVFREHIEGITLTLVGVWEHLGPHVLRKSFCFRRHGRTGMNRGELRVWFLAGSALVKNARMDINIDCVETDRAAEEEQDDSETSGD